MKKIRDEELYSLAKKYNENGKKALYDYLQEEYGIKNKSNILKRMNRQRGMRYQPETDSFAFNTEFSDNEEKLFMTIDELNVVSGKNSLNTVTDNCEMKNTEMEKLIQELIGDRLLELSRYISINSVSRTLIMDQTSLTRDGYQVIFH